MSINSKKAVSSAICLNICMKITTNIDVEERVTQL